MGTQETLTSNNQEAEMRSEAQRLSTFQFWPHNDKVEARKIAKAGFFHTGNDSEVKCPWCETVLTNWNYGDQVMARHRSANPQCPFIKNESDNVPLINNQPNVNTSQSESEDNEDPVIRSQHDGRDSPMDQEESHVVPDTTHMQPSTSSSTSSRMNTSSSRGSSPHVQDFSRFKSESARLETFRNWSHRTILSADLANAGFVYAGNDDHVQCVFCSGLVGNWEEEDFPMTEHRRLYPECPFIQGLEVGNIPIHSPALGLPGASLNTTPSPSRIDHNMSEFLNQSLGIDEVGLRPHRHAFSGPEKAGPNVRYVNDKPPNDVENVGIIRHSGPANAKYSTTESRLRSFRDWPPALRQEPKQLAEAGFYYIGLSDQTKCFYCDGGLRNWQPDDDPWTEHARWFSKCGFVRLIKGDEFIARCLIDRPPDPLNKDSQRPVTEEELKACMHSAVVQQALQAGIDHARIKMAMKKQLKEKGTNFKNVEALISATLNCQKDEDERFQVENTNTQPPLASSSSAMAAAESRTSLQTSSSSLMEQTPTTERSVSAPGSVLSNSEASASTSSMTNDGQKSTSVEGSELEQENRRLKEARICKVCMDNEVGVVFLPCGHLICCVNCAPSLKDCPMCRQSIHGTVKTYMS